MCVFCVLGITGFGRSLGLHQLVSEKQDPKNNGDEKTRLQEDWRDIKELLEGKVWEIGWEAREVTLGATRHAKKGHSENNVV